MFKNFKLEPKAVQVQTAKVASTVDDNVKTVVAFQFNVNTKEVDIFPNFVFDQPASQYPTQNEAWKPDNLDLL